MISSIVIYRRVTVLVKWIEGLGLRQLVNISDDTSIQARLKRLVFDLQMEDKVAITIQAPTCVAQEL